MVHIGTEKTGTTTVQTLFTHARHELRSIGVHYLRSPGRPYARDLAAAAVGDGVDEFLTVELGLADADRPAFAADVTARVAAEAAELGADVHTVFVSCEHFHSRLVHLEQVERLAAILEPLGGPVEILCYLRPQAELVRSHYSTRLRTGETRSLAEVVAEQLRRENPYVDYLGMLERYAAVFGEDAIDLRVYDRAQLIDGDIVADVAGVVGVAPALLEAAGPARVNESISLAGQELLREFNRRRAAVDDAVDAIALADTIGRAFPGRGEQLDPADVERAAAMFAADNEQIRRRWRPDLDRLFADVDSAAAEATPIENADEDAEPAPSSDAACWAAAHRAHVADLEADIEWLNGELGRRPVALVRKLLRRPPSRLRPDR